jgi:malate synthase
VTTPEQVTALVELLALYERALALPFGALKLELMIETTQAIIGPRGEIALGLLVEAARGRCVAAHFGTYDYTANCNITASQQRMTHPSCDFARHMMQVALARTGVVVSDGATTTMPIGPHRGKDLTPAQQADNRAVVHAAWRIAYDNIRDSLMRGFYQGWDLHPAQLPVRYAAVHAFFLDRVDAAAARLRAFVEKAAQANRVRHTFDHAATGQGLLNYFLRAINAGALTEEEARAHRPHGRAAAHAQLRRDRSLRLIAAERGCGDRCARNDRDLSCSRWASGPTTPRRCGRWSSSSCAASASSTTRRRRAASRCTPRTPTR